MIEPNRNRVHRRTRISEQTRRGSSPACQDRRQDQAPPRARLPRARLRTGALVRTGVLAAILAICLCVPGLMTSGGKADADPTLNPDGSLLVFNTVYPDEVLVPYGVDIQEWVNSQRIVEYYPEYSTSPDDHSSMAPKELRDNYYFPRTSAGPILYTPTGSTEPYTQPGSTVNTLELSWDSTYGGKQLELPDLNALALKVPAIDSDPNDAEVGDLLPVIPDDALAHLTVKVGSADAADVHATGDAAHGNTVVWLNKDISEGGGVLGTGGLPSGESMPLSDDAGLYADASFSSPHAGATLDIQSGLTQPGVFFAKLPHDVTYTDANDSEVKLYKGQVVRIPYAVDTDLPTIGSLSATLGGEDHQSIDLTGAGASDGVLVVDHEGISVTCDIADAQGGSGLDDADVKLSLTIDGEEKEVEGVPLAGDTYRFDLNLANIGAGTFDLSTASVNVEDRAGNKESSTLDQATPFSGSAVASVRIIDDESDLLKPTVELKVYGASEQSDGSYIANDASATVSVDLIVNDSDLGWLSQRSSWVDGKPLKVTVTTNGVPAQTEAVDLSQLVPSGDSYVIHDFKTFTGEGSFEVDVEYCGYTSLLTSRIDDFASDKASIKNDATGPTIIGMKAYDTAGNELDLDQCLVSGNTLIVSPQGFYLDVTFEDLLPENVSGSLDAGQRAEAATGIDPNSVKITFGTGIGAHESFGHVSHHGNTYRFLIGRMALGVGTYPLANLTAQGKDLADNGAQGKPLSDAVPFQSSAVTHVKIYDPAAGGNDVTLDYQIEDVTKTGENTYQTKYPGANKVNVFIDDPLFLSLRSDSHWSNSQNYHPITYTVKRNGNVTVDRKPLSPYSFTYRNLNQRFEREDAFSITPDGSYEVSIHYDGASRFFAGYSDVASDTGFKLLKDHVAPVVTGAKLKVDDVDKDHDISDFEGKKILVGSNRTLMVRVQDLLPDATDDEKAAVAGRDMSGTSGVKTEAVGDDPSSPQKAYVDVHLKRKESLDATETVPEDLRCEVDSSGWVEIPLDKEGIYSLSDIVIETSDNLDNSNSYILSNYEETLPNEEKLPYDAILVTNTTDENGVVQEGRQVKIDIVEDPDKPSQLEGFYRCDVGVKISITDKWFEVYKGIPSRADDFLTVKVLDPENNEVTGLQLGEIDPDDFTQGNPDDGGEPYTWRADYILPRDTSGEVFNGNYDIVVGYEGCVHDTVASKDFAGESTDENHANFSIDTEPPTLGQLTIDPIEPIKWGWILPAGAATVSVSISDGFSGIADDSVKLECEGLADAASSYENGVLTLTFDHDGSRMVFANTTFLAHDKVGNPVEVNPLTDYHPSNIPDESVGIVIDTVDPVLDVSYDNYDVRNGKYYNAGRYGTVTITESNFDIGKANDPDNAIVTVKKDGGSTEVKASDFENPSGDGITWVAGFDCSEDGEYVVDASYTDTAGRQATPYHEEFTVDTEAPNIVVMFDNNESQNGGYFKAPRTATVGVFEQNFAESASVLTAAKDASGNSVGGPGASGWTEGENGHTHECTVYFGDELHYTMEVNCTDLAGNVGEKVTVDEFVIDMTPPTVRIDGVEDHAAYAGEVKPTITYEDTNFTPIQATYTLTGANSGEVMMYDVTENVRETGEDVYYPDFEHVLERDDVYTLDATIEDMAGNTASDQRVFSVNRFGSNYVLIDGTQDIDGAYIDQPKDVTIEEINVSGLDTSMTHAEITHDSRQVNLVPGQDYTTEQVPGVAWSETRYRFPAQLFDADGYYRVFLTSTDLAGNLSQNTMDNKNETRDNSALLDFAVDMTNPEVSAYGVEAGGSYLSPTLDMQVDSWDNLGLQRVFLEVDGHEVASWDGKDAASGLKEWSLASDNAEHQITLTAVDKAGNTTRQSYGNIFIATDWIAYILNTPEVLYSVIVGIIGLLSALGIGLVLGHRHRLATEARRNPFGKGK